MRLIISFAIVFLTLPGIAQAGEKTVTLEIQQMDCALCKTTVRKALMKVDGVVSAEVSYDDKSAIVVFDDDVTTLTALTHATTNAGYPSTQREGQD